MSSTQQPQPNLRDQVKRVKELEDSILLVGKAMRDFEKSRMKEDTLILLLHDATGLPKGKIKDVLRGLKMLEEIYLKPAKAEGKTP